MTLFPRTLLWRSVLLIALVLGLAHIAWLQIFRVTEREPRARQVAQQIVSVVNVTRAALITADPGKRLQLLEELSQEEGIQVYLGHPGERVAPLGDRPFLNLVEREVRRHRLLLEPHEPLGGEEVTLACIRAANHPDPQDDEQEP